MQHASQPLLHAAFVKTRFSQNFANWFLRGSPLQTLCYTCRNFGHFASACPLRVVWGQATSSNGVPPFRPPPPPSAHPLMPRLPLSGQWVPGNQVPAADKLAIIVNNGRCNSVGCRFLHQCRVCFGPHPLSECPKRISR